MKVVVGRHGQLQLREIFDPVLIERGSGDAISVCMRDDTFEIAVIPKTGRTRKFRVKMESASIVVMNTICVLCGHDFDSREPHACGVDMAAGPGVVVGGGS